MKDDKTLSKVADKVKKLMAKANCQSSTEEEATLFALKAQQILEAHNMTLSDVEIQTAEMVTEDIQYKEYKRIPSWMVNLTSVVADYTYCKVVMVGTHKMVLLGAHSDVEVGMYIYEYLHTTIKKMATEYTRQFVGTVPLGKLSSINNSYSNGVVVNIHGRLLAERSAKEHAYTSTTSATGTELVPLKHAVVDNFMQSLFGGDIKQKTIKSGSDMRARIDGQKDGERVALRDGIRGSNTKFLAH